MKLIPTLATLCALLMPCALPAQTFEGKVTMKITSSSGKEGSQSIEMSMKEGFMRTDMATARGTAGMIMDFKNRQMIILMAAQRMYMVRPIDIPTGPRPQGTEAPKGELVDTGEKDTILGYPCTKYTYAGAKETSEIWVTDKLGTFGGLFQGGGPGGPAQRPPAWEGALRGKSFFPMKVVTTTSGSKSFTMEVTSVEKTTLPDSVFSAPSDWRKFDMGAMMGGAMQGAFPGGRPSDGNN